MKILLLSDLHLEFGNSVPIVDLSTFDIIVAAGDIGNGVKGAQSLLSTYPTKKIVYVCGNHEFYGSSRDEVLTELYFMTHNLPNFIFLENNARFIDGVYFWGSTLWTDFNLYQDAALGQLTSFQNMRDHRMISDSREWLNWHKCAIRSFKSTMEYVNRSTIAKSVVVTHFLPSIESVDKKYKGSLLNSSFASDLDNLIDHYQPTLWLHGHTHSAVDYQLHSTRVVSNPRGYPEENTEYSPVVIEI